MNEWQDLTEKELEEISKYYGPMSEGEWNLMLVAQEALRKKNTNQETAKDEPVAWLCCDGGTGYLAFAHGSVNVLTDIKGQVDLPLYLHPQEPKKPMRVEEVINAFESWAEKHHGIGEEK